MTRRTTSNDRARINLHGAKRSGDKHAAKRMQRLVAANDQLADEQAANDRAAAERRKQEKIFVERTRQDLRALVERLDREASEANSTSADGPDDATG